MPAFTFTKPFTVLWAFSHSKYPNFKYDACFYLNLPKVLSNQIQHHRDHLSYLNSLYNFTLISKVINAGISIVVLFLCNICVHHSMKKSLHRKHWQIRRHSLLLQCAKWLMEVITGVITSFIRKRTRTSFFLRVIMLSCLVQWLRTTVT